MTRDEAVKALRRHEKIAHDYMSGVRADHEADYRASTESLIAALTRPAPQPSPSDAGAVDEFLHSHRLLWSHTGDGCERRSLENEADAARASILARMRGAAVPDMGALMQAVARGWCHPANASKTMDPDLVGAIAGEVSLLLAAAPEVPR